MSQARTLSDKELKLLLLYIATRKYATRDRAMMLMTHWGGMRIGEVAATKIGDVLALDGTIKSEIRLTAAQTKGKHARTVILADKLRKELLNYLRLRFEPQRLTEIADTDMGKALFSTQKRDHFTANTACYHFHMLYKAAGIDGASSHSGRRGFLSSLSAKAVPLKVLMELAGHRQAQTTMRYVNVTTDMKKAAVELI
ncbi:site-specific integrase [Duganella sp. FT3S]|uniref:Site-specific integrase n=1 Tax=Rugamonas fusca TaxID=2758568 RepID=A0A7W2I924_9BURK|nr:site-specific integrase [Rugamonas fusca]MBA5608282.1 site-specific integrase [Rugamonas fusca]